MINWPSEHILFFEDGTHCNWTAVDIDELAQIVEAKEDKEIIEVHTYMPWQECVVKYGIEK